jgi:hypothetical protein
MPNPLEGFYQILFGIFVMGVGVGIGLTLLIQAVAPHLFFGVR